MKERRSND